MAELRSTCFILLRIHADEIEKMLFHLTMSVLPLERLIVPSAIHHGLYFRIRFQELTAM